VEILGEKVFYGPHHDKGVPRKFATRISVERPFSIVDEDLMTWQFMPCARATRAD